MTMHFQRWRWTGWLALALLIGGCSDDDSQQAAPKAADFQRQLQTKLIQARSGDVIDIPVGTYHLGRSLSLDVNGVTIRGAGMDKTVLSFRDQVAGAEGLLVSADNFTVEDLAIEDTRGDALKVNEGKNIIIRRVRTEWTNGPATENGSYGIYPVQTVNVLVEGCVARGASDAGIYVGQSRNVVVRNNRAEQNVAGIEIENSIDADVYGNVATGNAGGILVFNMPDLPQPGHTTRVFKNKVVANNTANFAPSGTAVSSVPAGSGVVINSNDEVEIFDNDIADNNTANVVISSYFSAGYSETRTPTRAFDPYPEAIYIHGNRFSGGGTSPDMLKLKALKLSKFGINGALPDILWDGIYNPAKAKDGHLLPQYAICVDNGDAKILNVDAGNDYKGVTTDMTGHRCDLPRLPAVRLPWLED